VVLLREIFGDGERDSMMYKVFVQMVCNERNGRCWYGGGSMLGREEGCYGGKKVVMAVVLS